MNSPGKQKGVALLFALGILSLILVMGVAFLGNALISQKIAVNNERSDFSRSLARSAADRALAHLMMFHLIQGKYALWDDYRKSDARTVYSTKSGSGNDMLGEDDSKLNVEMTTFKATSTDNKPWYAGKNSDAKWIYVHEDGTESNGAGGAGITSPIIGRFAYQVLPAGMRIPLYAMTAGAFSATAVTEKDTITGYPFRVPKLFRWGMDIDELVIPRSSAADDLFHSCWGPSGSSVYSRQHEYDNFFGLLSGTGSATPLGKDRKKEDVENLKRWVRSVFAEGRERLAPEAYTDNTSGTRGDRSWYPRFNLSEFTPFKIAPGASGWEDALWYSRFLDLELTNDEAERTAVNNLKNRDEVLDLLAGTGSGVYQEHNSMDTDYDHPIGLPFLKRIGDNDEKGAFDSVGDLRKQIAANLNDYCDSDSIPTSDKLASTWMSLVGKTDADELPKYTGNEKTPYINEIGFGFMMENAKIQGGSKLLFTAEISSELLAELINVYGGTMPVSVSALKLYGALKHLSLTLDISIKGNVTAHYKKADLTPAEESFSITAYRQETKSATLFDSESAQTFTIDWSSGVAGSGPYWVKNAQFPKKNISCDLTDVLARYINDTPVEALAGKSIDSYDFTLTGIRVAVTKVTFNLGNLILSAPVGDPPAGSTTPTEAGIDFVRVHQPGGGENGHEVSVPSGKQRLFGKLDSDESPATEVTSSTELNSETAANKCIFHLGGMEAVDPRQNLHAKVSQVRENDWKDAGSPSLDLKDKTSWEWTDFAKRVSGGLCNSCSKPNGPLHAGGGEIPSADRDVETVDDPAWQGDAAGQHISTAVIRNKPMRSPWELGFIHRGIPFQTINLKSAGGFGGTETLADDAHNPANFSDWSQTTGTTYANGDAGILDQIKMTEYNRSFGKLDFNDLRSLGAETNEWWISGGDVVKATLNRSLLKGLFENIYRQDAEVFLTESGKNDTKDCRYYFKADLFGGSDPGPAGTKLSPNPVTDGFDISTLPECSLRSKLLNNATLKGLFVSGENDAAQEELVGKTFNLIESKGYPELPRVFRVVIVAQTVGDSSGPGTFAAADDGIWSECRMLVTVERVSYIEKVVESGETKEYPRARLRIRQIEYLD